MTRRLVLAGLLALALTTPARAGLIYTLSQVGPDVVGSGSGSFNLAALTSGTTFINFGDGVLVPSSGTIFTRGGGQGHVGISSDPASFGPGGFTPGSFASGDGFGIAGTALSGQRQLVVPPGYTSGSPLSATDRWSGKTFADLGVIPGTYTWTWGSAANGTADFFTLQIGPAATPVPAPPTLLLGLVGVGCAVVARLRRQARPSNPG
jgi:hypothetical protein